MIIRRIWNKIVEWYKSDPNEKEEEKEFDEFLAKVEKRANKISAAQKATTHEGRAQVALMFESAYTQKKITEANDSLKTATWFLAIATIVLAVGTVYGVEELNKYIQIALQIGFGIIIIYLIFYVLKGIWKGIKFIAKK